MFLGSGFLVTVPVFLQAPLVRLYPWLSLAMTLGWWLLGMGLRSRPRLATWGDLMIGFTWTWLAGSLYWGWLRWEPLLHLPVESVALPIAILGLIKGREKIGHWFYIGSLLGTATTDAYFYLVKLIPHWRQLMQLEPDLMRPVFQDALTLMQTPWGQGCAIVLLLMLMVVGVLPLRSKPLHAWAFSGAVLSTILVDGLFWFGAAHY